MLYYGTALLSHARYAEGVRTLEEALRRSEGVLNPAHPFVVYPTALLGRQYSRKGRYAEAEDLLTKALTISRKAWGERNAGTFHNVAALAENYACQGRITDAETLLLDAVEADSQTDGLESPIAIHASYYLGLFYAWRRQFDQAERCVRPALRASIDSNGTQHPISFLGELILAIVYRDQGRYNEAEKQLEGPVSLVDVSQESTHLANVMEQLATVRQQQGRYAEAEARHLRVLSTRRKLLVENHPDILGTIRGLIALYTAWGKPQQAQQWFHAMKTAYIRQSAASQDSPATVAGVRHDPVADSYTLLVPPSPRWTIEKELDFSYPRPSSEMWHVCDDLHFAHKTLHGDGSILARIERVEPAHYGTQVSLMMRDTLDPASPQASVAITPLGDLVFQHRPIQLGATQSRYAADRAELPHWIRLTRKDNHFTAQHSGDGVNWEDFRDDDPRQSNSLEVPMGATVYIGLGFTSCDQSCMAETYISNVTVLGTVNPPGPFGVLAQISLGPSPSTKHSKGR